MQKVAVYRKERFNAAHRLFNPAWDDKKNLDVFGKCAYPNFHGHNYELIVRVAGIPDATTGFVMDMKALSDMIRDHVIEKFDHKNLNEDCPEFAGMNTSAENIAIVIYNILRPLIDTNFDLQIKLYETERNFVEYPVL